MFLIELLKKFSQRYKKCTDILLKLSFFCDRIKNRARLDFVSLEADNIRKMSIFKFFAKIFGASFFQPKDFLMLVDVGRKYLIKLRI